jgi:hypothetical protein
MHARETVERALALSERGASCDEIAEALGLSRWTVRDWLAGSIPHSAQKGVCDRCLNWHEFEFLPAEYPYLLGLYLGDGCLARHARDVYKLRIILDSKYPLLIAEAADAVRRISGRATVLERSDNCVEVYSFWRPWLCHFPQHGPGKKHQRAIALTPWQVELIDRWPEQLLRGLIQSDGCRFMSTGRCQWRAPRYAFSNLSSDIHGIFRQACERLGVRWTASGSRTTYVSRQADVAILDEFIGPKR